MPTADAVIGSQPAFEIVRDIGNIGLWLQAIGVLAVVWLVFSIINWVINSRRLKLLKKIIEEMKNIEKKIIKDLKRIEEKLDKLERKRK